MTENKERVKEKARRFYVRPLTEVYSADSCALLAGTYFSGDAGDAVFGNYFHGGGNAGGASFGSTLSGGGSSGGGGSAGGGSFGNAFSGGASPEGGSAGSVNIVTGAKDFGIGFSDVWE